MEIPIEYLLATDNLDVAYVFLCYCRTRIQGNASIDTQITCPNCTRKYTMKFVAVLENNA